MSNNNSFVGSKIKGIRESKNLSLEEIAESSGLSTDQISSIENGQTMPSLGPLIKIARVGTKKEVHPECDDNDFRLVFEIERIGQLFDDYKKVKLEIWRTFTDTNMGIILQMYGDTYSTSFQD